MNTLDRQPEHQADYVRLSRAILYLAEHWRDRPSLNAAAAVACWSPHHFQRRFTEWVGVSPKRFIGALALADAKARLAAGASVLDTALDVGLSGPGRLQDLFIGHDGLRPGAFKAVGAGEIIRWGLAATPLGEVLVARSELGIVGLSFVTDEVETTLAPHQSRFPAADWQRDDPQAADIAGRLFGGDLSDLALHLRGTNFQVQVWRALMAIPEGALTTYSRIAAALGKPRAARAVGSAVGANPLGIILPCHRVVRETGVLGGYAWGLARKRTLLGLEALRTPVP